MLRLVLLLQLLAVDSPRAAGSLQKFIAEAATENRAPPGSLAGYLANVETELALILRDSLGREIVGQLEQIAARATWERNGRYDLHVVGYRSQSAGAPYSALTFARMYTVPTLYGNRLAFGMNDGIPPSKRDSGYYAKRLKKDTAAGREPLRAIHPLAADRDRYYTFSGGDTVATLYARDRPIRLVRVRVEPVMSPGANFIGFRGEMDFDADRHQLVRMRGRLLTVSAGKPSRFIQATGAVAVGYIEFENAEVNGRYWLPAYQRSEFQAQMGLLGDVRPIFRLVSRFRNYTTSDSAITLAEMDSVPPRTRATLTYASHDSVSHFGQWDATLGSTSASVTSDDFNDVAPDVWKPTGAPRVDYWPRRLEDVVRYNRVEGMFTGISTMVRFRDLAPGLTARGSVGWAWTEQTARGAASLSLARGAWIHSARVERELASTNDFLIALESGLSIAPLISGTDDADYVDRRAAAIGTTRIFGNVDRAMLSAEVAVVEDRGEAANVAKPLLFGSFRANRAAIPGRYGRATATLELHPRVTGESLSPGFGARILYVVAQGDLSWQRVEARLAARRYWRGFVVVSRLDAGAVFASVIPPQQLYELGGYADLPSYGYKEFGGDRAALGSGLIAYHLPVLRTPRRIKALVVPGLSPGIGAGIQGGWAQASNAAARQSLLALGGDGVTPLSRPTDRIRATADFRLTIMSGAVGVGMARAIDQPDKWAPFFGIGLAF